MKNPYWTYRYTLLLLLLVITNDHIRGDTIFFESGVTYDRNLDLSNAGSEDAPLVITSRGSEKAIISAGSGYGFRLTGCSYVTISNLIIQGKGRLDGNTDDGLIISDGSQITIRDVEISGFQHSGLFVNGASSNIHISNVYSHNN